jgi:ribonuclease D
MNPDAMAVFIPIVAIGGFFALMIVRTLSKAYTAKLQAGSPPGAASEARHEELAAAVEELRREVAELAERVDFTERLLAKQHEGQKLAPPR